MLISCKYNSLFIRNPKVALSSLEKSLRKIILNDWEYFNYKIDWVLGRINFRLGNKVNLRNYLYSDPMGWVYDSFKFPQGYLNPHPSALEVKNLIGQDKYNELFKFAFVRNPWDLEVSMYKYLCWRKLHPLHHVVRAMSFEEYIYWKAQKGMGLQKRFLADKNGEIILDFIGRFETLQKDYEKILELLKLPEVKLPIVNQNHQRQRDYRSYYNEETKNIISEHLKEDIELFGYSF